MPKMAKGDLHEFEEAFRFACPKFLSPVSPNYDLPGGSSAGKEPYMQQLNVFKDEVQQQIWLPTIRCACVRDVYHRQIDTDSVGVRSYLNEN